MLFPTRIAGSLGAAPAGFRVLTCRRTPGWCGTYWSAAYLDTLVGIIAARNEHEADCTGAAINSHCAH